MLSKASNTDMDFTWVAQDDSNAIQNAIVDAKGDLITATAADTPARLAVGTNGQYLKANSSTSTGLEWAALSAFAPNFTLLNAGGTSTTGAATITVNVSSYDQYYVYMTGVSASAASSMYLRINGDTTTANYIGFGLYFSSGFNRYSNNFGGYSLAYGDTAARTFNGSMVITGGKSTGIKTISSGIHPDGSSANQSMYFITGHYNASAAITSISLFTDTGTFDAGTIFIYGA